MLEGTINNCAFPGQCENESLRPKLGTMETVVPFQRSYPLYFLASVRTTAEITNDGGPDHVGPWMDLMILTKASPSASWRLSFDSGYDAIGGALPPFLPFAFHYLGDNASAGAFNTAPTSQAPAPPKSFLALLASYWQSYKVNGRAPADSIFVKGGYAGAQGEQLAEERQNSIYNGSRQTYRFTANNGAGTWSFALTGNSAMECGTVLDDATLTPVSGLLNQDTDETNYGIPLAPGSYLSITTIADHESCVYVAVGGLAAVGDEVYDSNIVGKVAPLDLADLETAFGTLANQLSQYDGQYTSCTASSTTCLKTFGQDAAEQFGSFDSALTGFTFPSRDRSEVASLNDTARALYGLYESMAKGAGSTSTDSSIQKYEKRLSTEYSTLVRDLSK